MTVDGSDSPRRRFAERLRATRRARGFRTAKSFAERLGIDQITYTRYERGEAEPSVAMLERIWVALELPATDLFGPSAIDASHVADFGSSQASAARSAPPVTLRDTLVWRLAEAFVEAVPASSPANPGSSKLQRKGRLFLELTNDPFKALARLAADLPDHDGSEVALVRLDQAAQGLTILLEQETARRYL